MISVQFEGVRKSFGSNVVVDGLSLDVRPGELFFLLGPSGCGKTTCLRLVAGFYTPDAGLIKFDDRVMNAVPPHKRNAGMVFQNYALWPHMTVRGNVEYGLKVRKIAGPERDRRVNEALEMVRLGEYAARYPNQLSGGQQQRVALARALVIRPDVLLLDEPLSNLDAQLRLELRREIKRLHSQTGVTAIYVTHDQSEALSIADRVAVMQSGQVRQIGVPRDIYRAPTSRFVATFLGETNFLQGTVKATEGETVIVDTAVGPLISIRRGDANWSAGNHVWCSIRPETLVVGDSSLPETNRFAATLDNVMYLGETEQLGLRLTGGRETAGDDDWRNVKVSVLNPAGARPHSAQPLFLHCAPEDIVILAE